MWTRGRTRRRCLLLALLSCLAVGVSSVPVVVHPEHGAAHGVTWLVQLSDLHLHAHGHKGREADLLRFATRFLARLRPAAVLVTGDLTDSKSADGKSSRQYAEEWAALDAVAAALRAAAQLPPHGLLALRGNHDTFDVSARGGLGDLYSAHVPAWHGWGNGTARVAAVVVTPKPGTGSPVVTLLGVDATLEPGPKRPCNFVGRVTAQLEAQLADAVAALPALEAGGAPAVRLVATHYPLAVIIGGERLQRWVGATHGIAAVLNGHLHWRLGSTLHAFHTPPPPAAQRRVAELEAGDWKISRAWRLLALDAGGAGSAGSAPVLSFRDFRYDAASPGGMVVMGTSPPDGRYSSTAPAAGEPRAHVRALVFPPKGAQPQSLRVWAVALCAGTEVARVAMARVGAEAGQGSGGAVWTSPVLPPTAGAFAGSPFPLEAFARRCPATGGVLHVRVEASCEGAPRCGDAHEWPILFDQASWPLPLNNTRLEHMAMTWDANTAATALMYAALAGYATLTVGLPLLLARKPPSAGKTGASLPASLAAPFRALSARPRLHASHAAYVAYLCVGPWCAAELLSNAEGGSGSGGARPTVGALLAGGMWLPGSPAAAAWMPGMDAMFMTGPQLGLVTCPAALLVMCTLALLDGVRPPRTTTPGAALGATCRAAPVAAACLACGAGATAALALRAGFELRRAYGTVAVLLSPGMTWVLPLGCAAMAAGVAGRDHGGGGKQA